MSGQNIFYIHDIQTVSLLAIGGVLNMFALLCLYLGIARGPVSVAAPLVSLSTIFLAVQWYFMG